MQRAVCKHSTTEVRPFQLASESTVADKSSPDKFLPGDEPVFSISDELVLRNFVSVLQRSQDDVALLNAIMLTFALATPSFNISGCYLEYKAQALSFLREDIRSGDKATSESTIGVILLLAASEVRTALKFDFIQTLWLTSHLNRRGSECPFKCRFI